MIYIWKQNSRYPSSLAQTAGEVCASLEEEGRLTPENLVDVSRPEDAPLHKMFDWNDASAAEKYRKNQAMQIIRSVEVKVEKTKQTTPMFYHITVDETKPKYESIFTIMSSEDKYNNLLNTAKREMRTFTAKYKTISQLGKLIELMEETLEELEEVAS